MAKVLTPATAVPRAAREHHDYDQARTPAGLPTELRRSWGSYVVEHRRDESRLTVEAATLAALFNGAARAMSEQLGAGFFSPGPDEAHQVSIDAPNPDDLLSAWLGEILFHSRQAGRLFSAATLQRITPRHLRAELRADQGTRWFVDPHTTRIVEARLDTSGNGRRLVARVALMLSPLAPREG
jgi:SHS2 domain-containing protein